MNTPLCPSLSGGSWAYSHHPAPDVVPLCPDGMYPVRAVCPSLIPLAGGSQAQSRTLLSSGGRPLDFPRGRRLFEEPPTSGRCALMGCIPSGLCAPR